MNNLDSQEKSSVDKEDVNKRYVRMTLDNAIHYDDALLEVPVLQGLREDYDEPLVDPSYYVSSIERAKEAKKSSGEINKACYDYPDGKVIGDSEKIARIRRPGLDITELSEMADEAYKESQESLLDDIEKANVQKAKMRSEADAQLESQIKGVVHNAFNKTSQQVTSKD